LKLTHYITPGEEGETLEPVTPLPLPHLTMVPMTQQQADVLEEFGLVHCRLGTPNAQTLLDLVASYRLAGL